MNKPELNGEKIKGGIKRAMWLFMALLFVVTGLGVGLYAFWQGTHQNNSSSTTQTQGPSCSSDSNLRIAGSSSSDPLHWLPPSRTAILLTFTPVVIDGLRPQPLVLSLAECEQLMWLPRRVR